MAYDGLIDGLFEVVNADDYYEKTGFKKATEFLGEHEQDYALVGYKLKNTLSENGGVTGGICSVESGELIGIAETKNIVKTAIGVWVNGRAVNLESLVFINFWCCPLGFIGALKNAFPEFLEKMYTPLKDGLQFSVLPTDDKWFGVTYKEDKASVVESFKRLIEASVYKVEIYFDLR